MITVETVRNIRERLMHEQSIATGRVAEELELAKSKLNIAVADIKQSKDRIREAEEICKRATLLFDEVKNLSPKWYYTLYDKEMRDLKFEHQVISQEAQVATKKLRELLLNTDLTPSPFYIFVNSTLTVVAHLNTETAHLLNQHIIDSKYKCVLYTCAFTIVSLVSHWVLLNL